LPERSASVRSRVVSVVALAGVVAASGFFLDRKGPKAAVVGPIENTETGAWFCPHGGIGGGHGWVVVTNPGPSDVMVRVTTFGKGGVRGLSSFSVPSERQVYRKVPATEAGAASEIEYFGGRVGAAAVVQGPKSAPALAGERCVPSSRRTWFLLDQPTGRDETSYAVVMNPFSSPAQFDVIVRTEHRVISPRDLTPYVLPPRTSAAIPVNRYALESPGQPTVTTEVIQRLGRVVAGSFALTPGSLRAEAGESSQGGRWFVPGTDRGDSSVLTVLNPDGGRADVTVIRQGPTIQEVLSGNEGVSVAPQSVLSFSAKHMAGAGLLVESTNKGRIAAAAILAGPGADTATMDGAAAAASSWLVLPTLPAGGGKTVLILQNPGRAPVDVAIRVIGDNGSLQLTGVGSRTVSAGRTVMVPLRTATGLPVSAIATSKDGTFVAAEASYVGNGTGYAATLGLPMTGLG